MEEPLKWDLEKNNGEKIQRQMQFDVEKPKEQLHAACACENTEAKI